jgi:hypothetical protein
MPNTRPHAIRRINATPRHTIKLGYPNGATAAGLPAAQSGDTHPVT